MGVAKFELPSCQVKNLATLHFTTLFFEDSETPTISSFIHNQTSLDFLDQDEDDHDDLDMQICVLSTLNDTDQFGTPTITSFAKTSSTPTVKILTCPSFHLTNVQMDISTHAWTTTPLALYDSIVKHHKSKSMKPSKTFLCQHLQAINQLPSSEFQKFGNLVFHVNGGANCGAVRDNCSFFFIESPSEITDVGGKTMHSPGWGGILICIDDTIQLMAPVYLCPGNPRNTLSTTSLIQFTACQSAVVNTNK
jgi:hypothetical protein